MTAESRNERLTREHFDALADKYDLNGGTYLSPLPKLCSDRAAELVLARAREGVIDIGCGTGYLLAKLAAEVPGFSGAGADISPRMLDVARGKLAGVPGVTLVEATADDLPFPDESFGAAVCVMSFHHYPRPEAALGEAARVLASGGIYVIADPLRESGTLEESIAAKRADKETGEYAIYTPRELAAMAENAGLEVTGEEFPAEGCFLLVMKKP